MPSWKIAATPDPKLVYSNRVYISQENFDQLARQSASRGVETSSTDRSVNVLIEPWVFLASPHEKILDDSVALNSLQRQCGSFSLNQPISVKVFIPDSDVALASLTIALDLITKKKDAPRLELEVDELSESLKTQFTNQIFCVGQRIAMDFPGSKFDLIIDSFEHASVGVSSRGEAAVTSPRGQLLKITTINWKKQNGSQSNIVFKGAAAANARNDSLFRSDFDFEKMGIGGLGAQFQTMFRRAFASRIFPGLVKQLGINHIRGILLYGPPGCGKTLIARQIGKVLNAREPKIINGPEVLDKFVGGSEEKIRALFADAEKEQAEAGDDSMLHIIIFDEMDAVMKQRGSTRDSTGVSDSIVNQLLSKIDGVDALNNILIIGMTNRKDMIDEAILRPGRLELHIEISLPSEEGRLQILNIHTSAMRKHSRIAQEALDRLPELAQLTKNFTGAEIEGMVRAAASFPLARSIDAAAKTVDEASLKVEWRDFERAIGESSPAFGNKEDHEMLGLYKNGICKYGSSFDDLWETLARLMKQTRTSERTPLMSVLLEGPSSTGKTALAAKLCVESNFPYVRMISADSMIGYSESQKCAAILRTFSDSYKSPLSVIFIDDIERILEYTPIGPRFSNSVLQTLLVLLRKIPPHGFSRLLVVATTSISHHLESLQLTRAFNVTLQVSQLQSPEEIAAVLQEYSSLPPAQVRALAQTVNKPIGIKQLLLVLEMARAESASDGSDSISQDLFMTCLQTVDY